MLQPNDLGAAASAYALNKEQFVETPLSFNPPKSHAAGLKEGAGCV
jgi:hypothetical protein